MLSGVINTAFSYITSSASDTSRNTLRQARVRCSTADDGEGRSTAMSQTSFTGVGRRLVLQGSRHDHEQCKGETLDSLEPQVSHS